MARRVPRTNAGGPAVVGVIPAAGYAKRLQPLGCSKEVVVLGGRPVMDYLIERMQLAECSEIRVVTRPEKLDVIENARRHGATVIERYPRSVAASIVLGMEGLQREDVVLFGFPDTVWEPSHGFRELLDRVAPDTDVVLGLFRTSELERSDVVVLGDAGLVEEVQVKPSSPRANTIWGCGAARRSSLAGLGRYKEPGHFFDALARRTQVLGVLLSDAYVDIGTRDSLRRAAALEDVR